MCKIMVPSYILQFQLHKEMLENRTQNSINLLHNKIDKNAYLCVCAF